jgi:hypothetical protein
MGREARAKKARSPAVPGERVPAKEGCGLCGRQRESLLITDCCGHLICNDEGDYVPFSYSRNSCSRNHRRYTLCGYHHAEGHSGAWQTCKKCRKDFETEMYVYYGTNEYNFEKLENPPAFKPTRCHRCGRVIALGEDGFVCRPDGSYACSECGVNE